MSIVSITGNRSVYSGEPDPTTVEMLEDLLERARSGEIQGVIGAMVYRDSTATGFYAGYRCNAMLGALTKKQHQLCAALTEDDQ